MTQAQIVRQVVETVRTISVNDAIRYNLPTPRDIAELCFEELQDRGIRCARPAFFRACGVEGR